MFGYHIANGNIAHGSRCSYHEGTRLYLIRYYCIAASLELLTSLYPDDIGARTLDIGAHAIQKISYVHHMGLLCGVYYGSVTLGFDGSQHYINGGPYADHIQIYLRAHQPFSRCLYYSMFNEYIGAQGRKSLNMLIYRPCPYIATSRKGHLSLSKSPQ